MRLVNIVHTLFLRSIGDLGGSRHKNKGNIRISLSWYFTIGQYNQGNTRISLSWYFYNWTIKPGQYMYITLPELYN
jgi:hypothetical protein